MRASIRGSDTPLHGGSFETLSLEPLLERESELACLRRIRADLLFGGAAGLGRGLSCARPSRPFAPPARKQLRRMVV